MMATARDRMVALADGTKVKVLGYLTWFTVPDEAVPLTRLKKQWVLAGLDPDVLPKGQKAVNTFQRAVRSVDQRRRTDGAGQPVAETRVDEVSETSDYCVYQVTRLERHVEERVIEHPKAMRVIFDKVNETIRFEPLGDVPKRELNELIDSIQEFYDSNQTRVPGHKVRAIVRNMLSDLLAENLRGKAGGIYFVPFQGYQILDQLNYALKGAYKERRAYMRIIPMADSHDERDIIAEEFEINSLAEIEEIMEDTAKVLNNPDRVRAVRSDVIQNQWDRHAKLMKKAKNYQELLNEESDDVAQALDVLKKQLHKLEEAGSE